MNENGNGRFGAMMSGLNPNSFPGEGESERFIQEKLRDVSYESFKRVAKLVSKGDRYQSKGVQTFKELSEEYAIEMKVQR